MNDSNEAKISELLQEGLERYGAGDVAQAFLLWDEVLAIDPDNEEALDYIRDADRRTNPRDDARALGKRTHVDDARSLIRSEGSEAALEWLLSVGEPGELEREAMIDLLRASLFDGYASGLGDLGKVPKVAEGATGDLQRRNLPPVAGFLISMIDGKTPWGDVVSLSGMDRFDVVRTLSQMFDADILEWA